MVDDGCRFLLPITLRTLYRVAAALEERAPRLHLLHLLRLRLLLVLVAQAHDVVALARAHLRWILPQRLYLVRRRRLLLLLVDLLCGAGPCDWVAQLRRRRTVHLIVVARTGADGHVLVLVGNTLVLRPAMTNGLRGGRVLEVVV